MCLIEQKKFFFPIITHLKPSLTTKNFSVRWSERSFKKKKDGLNGSWDDSNFLSLKNRFGCLFMVNPIESYYYYYF